MQHPENRCWSGRLCVKGLYVCMAQIEHQEHANLLSKWGSDVNIKWRTKTTDVKEKFLPGLTEFQVDSEVQCNGWFVNCFTLIPYQCPANFHKLVNYFRKSSHTSVLKHDDEVLLMGDGQQMTQLCGCVASDSSREETLICLLLSKTSKRSNQAKSPTHVNFDWLHENVTDVHFQNPVPECSKLQPQDVQEAFQVHHTQVSSINTSNSASAVQNVIKCPKYESRQGTPTQENVQMSSPSLKQRTPRKRLLSSSSSDTDEKSYADRLKDLASKSDIERSLSEDEAHESSRSDSSNINIETGKDILEKACESYCLKLYETFRKKDHGQSIPKRAKVQPSSDKKLALCDTKKKKVKKSHTAMETKESNHASRETKESIVNETQRYTSDKSLSAQNSNSSFCESKKKRSDSTNIFDEFSEDMSKTQISESKSLKSNLKSISKSGKSHHHMKEKMSSSSKDREPERKIRPCDKEVTVEVDLTESEDFLQTTETSEVPQQSTTLPSDLPRKKVKAKHRITEFNPAWTDGRPWLYIEKEEKEGKIREIMFCSLCKKHKVKARNRLEVWTTEGCRSVRLDKVYSHANSDMHKEALRLETREQLNIQQSFESSNLISSKDQKAIETAMKCLMFLVKHKIPHTTVFKDFIKFATNELESPSLQHLFHRGNATYTSHRTVDEFTDAMVEDIEKTFKRQNK